MVIVKKETMEDIVSTVVIRMEIIKKQMSEEGLSREGLDNLRQRLLGVYTVGRDLGVPTSLLNDILCRDKV